MTTIDQIRHQADEIRKYLASLDESDTRLKKLLAINAESREQGLAVLAMADAELAQLQERKRCHA